MRLSAVLLKTRNCFRQRKLHRR